MLNHWVMSWQELSMDPENWNLNRNQGGVLFCSLYILAHSVCFLTYLEPPSEGWGLPEWDEFPTSSFNQENDWKLCPEESLIKDFLLRGLLKRLWLDPTRTSYVRISTYQWSLQWALYLAPYTLGILDKCAVVKCPWHAWWTEFNCRHSRNWIWCYKPVCKLSTGKERQKVYGYAVNLRSVCGDIWK